MERCLRDFNFETVLVYLIDMIIFSKAFEEQVKHLDCVFSPLAQYRLKLKPSTCHMIRQKIQYLGHIFKADPAKVQGIQDWHLPKTITELFSFLGLVGVQWGYYQRFNPRFAQKALTQLLSGHSSQMKCGPSPSIQAQWYYSQQHSYGMLKQRLTSAPLLAYADYTLPFRV